jgi:hypothetical protein
MVVKPLEFIAKNRRGLIQPAVKCRGREYLRIIYGPEYTATENLERLRARGLSTKRSLASANSHSASKRLSGSSAKSRYAGFTKLSLACWHWRASPLIPACEISRRTEQHLRELQVFRLCRLHVRDL